MNKCCHCESVHKVHKSSIDNNYYCNKHYLQLRRLGKLLPNDKERKNYINDICIVDSCNNKNMANGYCKKHYFQLRKYGKILKRTIFDKNEIVIHDNYAEMYLYNQDNEHICSTYIDIEDINKICKYKWGLTYAYGVDYAYVSSRINGKIICLQNFLFDNKDKNLIVDFIDRNPLNNRKINYRLANKSQNAVNQNLSKNNTSGVNGVYWNKQKNKWNARIKVNYKSIDLGYYSNLEDAKKARERGAEIYFGEFAPVYKNKANET